MRDAEQRIRSATLVAGLFGILTLIIGLESWEERRHLDLELLVGFIDSAAVLVLAAALSRRSLAAAWLLVVLTVVGAAYTLWGGAPVVAVFPHAIAALLYVRALRALLLLRNVPRPAP